MNNIQKRLIKRLRKDYKNYILELLKKDKKEIINNIYNMAGINNFFTAFNFCLNYYPSDFCISNDLIKIAIDYKSNLLMLLFNISNARNYTEDIDFWIDTFYPIEIFEDILKEVKEKKYERK